MPLIRAASLLIALSKASGPSSRPPVICPRSAILHSARRVDRRRHLGRDRLDGGENRDLRPLHVERDREIDRVLADVDLVLQRRRDVDRRVGDDQDLVVGRHVHDEDVADAPADAQAGLLRHDRAQQLVGVQAALHQQLGLAGADQRHRLRGRRMAVRGVDDPALAEVDAVLGARAPRSWPPGRRGSARSVPCAPASTAPASAECSHGCATAVGTASRLRHRSSSASYLPVPVFAGPVACVMVPLSRLRDWRGEPRCPFLSVTE